MIFVWFVIKQVISLSAFWSQWDSSCQRLYYALPIHKFSNTLSKVSYNSYYWKKTDLKFLKISKSQQPNELTSKFHLICLQFYRNKTYDKVFDIQVTDLILSQQFLNIYNILILVKWSLFFHFNLQWFWDSRNEFDNFEFLASNASFIVSKVRYIKLKGLYIISKDIILFCLKN